MKRVLRKVLLAFLLSTPVAATHSAEIVMGVEDLPYMPYYSVDMGEYNGYARELFDAFAADRGHSISYRPLPVERLYRALLDGEIDLKFPDNPEWRNDLKEVRKVHYSGAVAPFLDGVLVTPHQKTRPADGPLRIGTIRGFTPWPLLGRIEEGSIKMFENNSISGLLRQVLVGRLDGVFINESVAEFHLKSELHQEGALVLDDRLPNSPSAYYVSSIQNPVIIQELNDWLTENGEKVKALQQKWGIK
jgi:polar amino acid transport system substrate-binding protein